MILLKNFIRKNKYPLLILAISMLVYFRWLSFQIVSANDWYYFWSDSLRDLISPSIWLSHYNFGQVSFTLWRYPFDLLAGLIASLGFNSNVGDKLLYFWPLLIFSSLGSYFLAKQILKLELAAFVASVVFCFNSYFLAITGQGHLLISLAGALSTFALLFFIKYFDDKKAWNLLASVLITFLVGAYDLRVMYILVATLALYDFFELVSLKSIKDLTKENLFLFLSAVILFGLLNLYWFLPTFVNGSISENAILNRGLFGDNFWNLIDVLTLHHPFWSGGKINWFVLQAIPYYFYFIPILAFLGAVVYRKNNKIIFFLILALIGIFFAKQSDSPFPQVYLLFYQKVPGFNAFREASKFYLLIIVGYSILIGALAKWIYLNKEIKTISKFLPHILIVIILSLFLLNTKPIISGEIDSLYVSKQIPADYQKIGDYEKSQEGFFNVLWLPGCSRWTYYSNQHPAICAESVSGTTWSKITDFSEVGTSYPKESNLIEIVKKEQLKNILKDSSIKYVVVPTKDLMYGDDLFQYYGQAENYIDYLDQKEFLEKVDIGTETTRVYRNKAFNDFISLDQIGQSDKNKSLNIQHKRVNSSLYKISVSNIAEQQRFKFGQNYDPNWSARLGDFSVISSLFAKDYSSSSIIFQKSDFGLTEFTIDPNKICQNKKCQINSDGSFDIELYLYYKPQSYLWFGLAISAFSLLVILSMLLISLFKKTKRVNEKK